MIFWHGRTENSHACEMLHTMISVNRDIFLLHDAWSSYQYQVDISTWALHVYLETNRRMVPSSWPAPQPMRLDPEIHCWPGKWNNMNHHQSTNPCKCCELLENLRISRHISVAAQQQPVTGNRRPARAKNAQSL